MSLGEIDDAHVDIASSQMANGRVYLPKMKKLTNGHINRHRGLKFIFKLESFAHELFDLRQDCFLRGVLNMHV
jgi:hypothetical protein